MIFKLNRKAERNLKTNSNKCTISAAFKKIPAWWYAGQLFRKRILRKQRNQL